MKVSEVLWRWKKALPGGHLWRGKHRLYKKVTPLILANKRSEFEVEERNMFYLRHPYLTVEQSSAANLALASKHYEKYREKITKENLKWKDHAYLGDRFGFLKVADKWE